MGEAAAFAAAAFFGGAGLVENQGRYAGQGAQFALDDVEFVPVADGHAVGNVGDVPGPVGAVGDEHDVAHPFGLQLAQQLGHREFAIHRLAAGHRHGVVEQDLVGDAAGGLAVVGRAVEGGHGLADGQDAGEEIGAVAEVGKDVLVVGVGSQGWRRLRYCLRGWNALKVLV